MSHVTKPMSQKIANNKPINQKKEKEDIKKKQSAGSGIYFQRA